MKKLIATVISIAALSSCVCCKTSTCATPETETPNHLMDMATEDNK